MLRALDEDIPALQQRFTQIVALSNDKIHASSLFKMVIGSGICSKGDRGSLGHGE